MTLSDYAKQYAPDLLPLVPQLEEVEDVLAGWGAGPQKSTDPDQRQHLDVLIDNPWRQEQWVTIYSASECVCWSGGEMYWLTLNGLLDYLRQLPKPIRCFSL